MASHRRRINRVLKALRDDQRVVMRNEDIARVAVDADPGPDMMGTAEVAEALECSAGNLYRQAGLPEPDQKLRAGPIWRADRIRKFIIERNRRRRG